jgi:hypothetical protein
MNTGPPNTNNITRLIGNKSFPKITTSGTGLGATLDSARRAAMKLS